MQEIEVKAWITPQALMELRRQLEAEGFEPGRAYRQQDLYYLHPARDFFSTDEALRLRHINDMNSDFHETKLTYKGPSKSTFGQSREELECSVPDGETVQAILERLGFQPAAVVTKERTTLHRQGLTFCLDTVEDLGSFLEIEVLCQAGEEEQARHRIEEAMAWAAFANPIPEPATYLELILRRRKKHG